MRKSKYTEEQIIVFLHLVEAGMPVKDLCRKHGFGEAPQDDAALCSSSDKEAAGCALMTGVTIDPVRFSFNGVHGSTSSPRGGRFQTSPCRINNGWFCDCTTPEPVDEARALVLPRVGKSMPAAKDDFATLK